jgi:2,4-dienoyl-CoA reductase-like NADH-dependent reductase (Old Yellow Enzyme family)
VHRRQRTLRSVRAEAVPEWQVATENVPSDQGSIVASPCRIFMGQGLANPWTADVTPALIRLYERWADGGTGTLITGVICVRRGAEDNVIVALDDRTDTDALRRWASAVHRRDVRLLGQIQHPCRQVPAYMARHPGAPSALPLAHGSRLFGSSRALTADEITDLVEKSANAAAMLEQAGFDGAEL